MLNKIVDKQKKRHHTRLGVQQTLMSPWEREKSEKKNRVIGWSESYVVTHPYTD